VTARRLGWIALVVWPFPASAHSPIAGIKGFYTGLRHPFSTPPQALLMLGLGLMIAGVFPSRVLWPLGVFAVAMVGGMMTTGFFGQLDMAMFGVAFVACGLSALATGRLLPAMVAVAAVRGVYMGVASLADPGPTRDRIITTLGAFVGANIGLLLLAGIPTLIQERYTWTWVPVERHQPLSGSVQRRKIELFFRFDRDERHRRARRGFFARHPETFLRFGLGQCALPQPDSDVSLLRNTTPRCAGCASRLGQVSISVMVEIDGFSPFGTES
jgi:hydrogenase/urease accessory protein HupE